MSVVKLYCSLQHYGVYEGKRAILYAGSLPDHPI